MTDLSAIDVTTATSGLRELNDHLRQGWQIIQVQFVEHIIRPGSPTTGRQAQWIPYALLGRSMADMGEAEADRLREVATDAGETALRPTDIELEGQGGIDVSGGEETPPMIDPDPKTPQQQTRPPASRRIRRGQGEFEGTGIRA